MHRLRPLLLILVVAVLVPAGTAVASPPGNDERVNYVTLNGATAGTNVDATHTYPHEGDRPGNGTHSVWYRYVSATTGRVTITVNAPSFNSVVAAYPGWYSPSDGSFVSDADTGGGDTASAITFDTKAGQLWEIAVDGYAPGQTGSFTITPTFDATPDAPANDDFADAQTIDPGFHRIPHRYATAEAGEPEHRITGTPAKSVWFKWTPLVSGYARLGAHCGSADLGDTKAVVAVYTGATLGTLDEIAYTKTPTAGECTAANVTFKVVAGTAYRFVLDNASADTGQGLLTFEFDSVPPTTTFKGTKTLFGPGDAIEWQADEYGTTFKCRLDGGSVTNCGTSRALTNVSEGPHTLEVRGIDELGNEEAWRSKSFTVDRTPPQTTIQTGPAPAIAHGVSPTFTFSSDDAGATFVCGVVGKPLVPCTSPYALAPQSFGSHTFRVIATDAQGNADATPATWDFKVDGSLPTGPPTSNGTGKSTYVPPAPAAPLPVPAAAVVQRPATTTASREVVGIGVQTRITRAKLAKPGLKVAVRCPFGCRAVVTLRTARGKLLKRVTAKGGTTATLKLRRAPLGTHTVTVTGPSGESRSLKVRVTAR